MHQQSAMLRQEMEQEIARLVTVLGGRADGLRAMCHCPAHDDRTPSLSIRAGEKRLLFKCFAGCDTHDVLRALRGLRLYDGRQAAFCRSDRPKRSRMTFDGRSAALALWEQARPVDGSLAALYLATRGIGGQWPQLRYHPHVPLGRGRAAVRRPALLCAIIDDNGFCAVQRSFVDPQGAGLARDVDPARYMLGRPGRGAVRLAVPDECLGIAEGLESAISAMVHFRIPVWATLGSERFGQIAIPDRISTLILLPDNDLAGRRGAQRAQATYVREGRQILTRLPPHPFNDWNDLLQQEGVGKGEVRWAD